MFVRIFIKIHGGYSEHQANSISPPNRVSLTCIIHQRRRERELNKAPLLVCKSTFGCLLYVSLVVTLRELRLSLGEFEERLRCLLLKSLWRKHIFLSFYYDRLRYIGNF